MGKLKIKLFGELWRLTKLNIDQSLKARAIEMEEPWPIAILSVDFFDTKEFQNITNYNDIGYLYASGLLNAHKSQIEIWYKGKRITKLKMSDLNNDHLLFPLYERNTNLFNYTELGAGIYVEECEIGLVGCCEIEVIDFKLYKLLFNCIIVQNGHEIFEILDTISYERKVLNINRKNMDALITKQVCFEV